MQELLLPVAALGGLGVVFGALLGVAAKAFKVETDDRVEALTELLPGANCGACGFAGCGAMAEALIKGEAALGDCAAMDAENAAAAAGILGIESGSREKRVARVLCSGTCDAVAVTYLYDGLPDCVAAERCSGGGRACRYGCSGFGSCVRACRFGAISLQDGVARVAIEKCVGCGACASACPRQLIALVPAGQKVVVTCRSREKGAAMKDICRVGCVGCGLCQRSCPAGAVTVTEHLAAIDYALCTNCGICAEKCPKKVISYSGGTDEEC